MIVFIVLCSVIRFPVQLDRAARCGTPRGAFHAIVASVGNDN